MPNMMDFPLSETLRAALSEPENEHASGLRRLYEAMVNDRLYSAPAALVAFEGNHDMPRLYSVLGENVDNYRIALVYLATVPRIPQLYYGTEVLMTSPTTRDDAASRRDLPGGWAGDRVNAFTGAGLSPRQIEAQTWLRTLLNWRKTATAVHSGRFLHYLPREGVYVYFRDDGRQRVMIVLSRNDKALELQLDRFAEGLKGATDARNALTGMPVALGRTMTVPAHAALVLDLCASAQACGSLTEAIGVR
jgi:neopullulanase